MNNILSFCRERTQIIKGLRGKFYLPTACLCLISLLLLSNLVKGQKPEKLFVWKGEVGLYGDFYHMEADSAGSVLPRRPSSLGRLVVNASLKIKDFSLPINASIPTMQYSTLYPNLPQYPDNPFKNFTSNLKNPINRVGIAPEYKWAKVLLGSQVPNYSELSVGDLAVFGAGLELKPGNFRFSCFAGTSQIAIEEDIANGRKGIYGRKIYSGKIGFGHEDSSHIYIIGSVMKDDTNSLRTKPINLMPQNGILGALDFRINLTKKFFVKGEIGGSAFSRDQRSPGDAQFKPSLPKNIFGANQSSRLDYASVFSVGRDAKHFSFKITGRYLGDGFMPTGYPFMQTDRLDLTFDPRFNLFKNKVQISGSVGKRVNNLSANRGTTATQSLLSTNANFQLTNNFSLSGSYSNFGFKNTIDNDTFKIELISESWSISPSYSFMGKRSIQNFSLTFSKNNFKDFNTVTGSLNDNDATNGIFSYLISTKKRPFSGTFLLSYFENQTSFGKLVTQSGNIGAAYKFFKKKLTLNGGLTFAQSTLDKQTSGNQIMSILGLRYTLMKKIRIGAAGSVNLYKFGQTRPGISYREDFLQLSLTYNF